MAASDHLGPQFYHSSNHEFSPGETLTRQGAFAASHPSAAEKLEASKSDHGGGDVYYPDTFRHAPGWKTDNNNYPVVDHLYYGDKNFVTSGESKGYGQNTYAVQPVTPAGRPSNKHQADPNYTSEGMTGAYRTKGGLKVLGKVDGQGNLLP